MSEQKSTRRWLQYLTGFLATLGGLSLGLAIGWASPAQQLVKDQLKIENEVFSWIASIMPLGAAFAMIFTAFTFDVIGRKWTMIGISPFFTLAWILLICSNQSWMYFIARFLCGFCGATFCVAAPNYTAELSEAAIRGLLGTLFQLMVCTGIAAAYCLGEAKSLYALGLPGGVIPIIVGVSFLFIQDSPVYLMKKGKEEKAKKALKFFRGPDYNIDAEIDDIKKYVEVGEESAWEIFKKKSSIKATIMLLVLHVGQQMSGINAVMFFAHEIFEDAGSEISPGISSIIIGVIQIIATGLCTLIVDRVGRKVLWIISVVLMMICLAALGVFFLIKQKDPETAKSIGTLPLISLGIYIIAFSLGAGPLPWSMLGELLPNQIKSTVGSVIGFINWMLAFIVTVSFTSIVTAVGSAAVYFGFTVLLAFVLIFIILVLIETKNKTLEQIQVELGG